MASAPRRALALVLLAGATASCAAILGFERLEAEKEAAEGGADGALPEAAPSDAGDAGADGACEQVGVAPPPPAQPASDASDIEREFAVSALDFGIDTSVDPVGLNVDRRCTSTLDTSSCVVDSADKLPKITDYKNGVDNSGFRLIQDLSQLGGAFTPDSINKRLKDGEYGLIVRIRGYNGTANDDAVSVDVYPALRHGVDGGAPDGGRDDLWVRDRSYNFVDSSTIRSTFAYVNNGQAVAFFPTFELPISVPDQTPAVRRMRVKLRDVWLTGTLTKLPDGNDGVKGVLAGRWSTRDFLDEVRPLDLPGFGTICKSPLVYAQAKALLCPGRDVRATSAEDGRGLPCDAVSAGIGYVAYAVDNSTSEDPPVIANPCLDGGSAVPLDDDCK